MGKPFTLSDSICATFEVIIDLIQNRTSTNVIELLASGANRSLLRHIAQLSIAGGDTQTDVDGNCCFVWGCPYKLGQFRKDGSFCLDFPAAVTLYDRMGNNRFGSGQIGVICMVENLVGGFLSQQERIDIHCGQLWRCQLGIERIVKGNNGYVIGNG